MVVVPSVLRVVNRYWVSGVLRSMKLSSEAKMYLSNVDLSTKKSEILDLCNTAVGKQVALNVRFGKHHTGHRLEHCIVDFDTPEHRDTAVRLIDGVLLNNRELGASTANGFALPLSIVLCQTENTSKDLNEEELHNSLDELLGRKCVKTVRKSSSLVDVYWITFHSIAGARRVVPTLDGASLLGTTIKTTLFFVPPSAESVTAANNLPFTVKVLNSQPFSIYTLKLSGAAVKSLSKADIENLFVPHVGEQAVVGVRECFDPFSERKLDYCLVDLNNMVNFNKALQAMSSIVVGDGILKASTTSVADNFPPGDAVLLLNLPAVVGELTNLFGNLKVRSRRKGTRISDKGEPIRCLLMEFHSSHDAREAHRLLNGSVICGSLIRACVV